MSTFEKWQVITNSIQTGILFATFLGAVYIGFKQIEINDRLRALQDFVAVSAVPGPTGPTGGTIRLNNSGKTNLYLWGFDMPGNIFRYDKPRLLSVGTDSFYWIPSLDTSKVKKFPYFFEFKLYLEDEFGQKWISENGGEADSINVIKVWSHKTYKEDWSFEKSK